jgi:Zn-dependent protease with chaperone function
MQWFYVADGAKVGPVSREELDLRHSAYLINSQTLVCSENSSDWRPYSEMAGQSSAPPLITKTSFVSTPQLSIKQLRDSGEKTAFTWLSVFAGGGIAMLIGILVFLPGILIVVPIVWLFQLISEYFICAYIKTHSIRVSERQLPEIYKAVEHCSRKLQVEMPEVYIMQQGLWNAFAARMAGKRMVVLFSGAVDSILLRGNVKQLTWLIGHEIGHLAAGHLDWPRKFVMFGAWVPWLYLWYSRRRELTCDRIGLYCIGEAESSYLAMLNATVGAQLAKDVNISAALADAESYGAEFFVRYSTFYSSYPTHLARLQKLRKASADFGIA